jgi:uncharacterized membrane protein
MGDITELGLHLALLFLPGIVCALLVERLVPTTEWSTARLALYSLVLGLICYQGYALFDAIYLRSWPPPVSLFRSLNGDSPLDFSEIFWVTIAVAPLVGMIVAFVLNSHWINRFARTIRVSDKFGELDVWARILNSSEVVWLVVRDFANDLAFDGWVEQFSDAHDDNEIFLRDVRVYKSSSSEFLYELAAVYLTRRRDELTIEIRKAATSESSGDAKDVQH